MTDEVFIMNNRFVVQTDYEGNAQKQYVSVKGKRHQFYIRKSANSSWGVLLSWQPFVTYNVFCGSGRALLCLRE